METGILNSLVYIVRQGGRGGQLHSDRNRCSHLFLELVSGPDRANRGLQLALGLGGVVEERH